VKLVGHIKAALVAFGIELGRTLIALVIQFAAPILVLYLVLTVPPLFGCLGYSDRPGPGCYGLSSRVGVSEFAHHATAMVSYAVFAGRFLWPSAFLCILLALLTKWRPRTRWLRATLLGIVGFLATGYLMAAAGWYMALSGTGALVVALAGAAVAAFLVPRLIAPGHRSNKPLERPGVDPRVDVAAASAGRSAPSRSA
jgi:uncharacterized membrane protein YeaQ/YmgE (transglycosylase-associated protein family)